MPEVPDTAVTLPGQTPKVDHSESEIKVVVRPVPDTSAYPWEDARVLLIGSLLLKIVWLSKSATFPETGVLDISVQDFDGRWGHFVFQWSGTMEEAQRAAAFVLNNKRVPGPEDTV